jgi:hypothetical protein
MGASGSLKPIHHPAEADLAAMMEKRVVMLTDIPTASVAMVGAMAAAVVMEL